MVHLLLAGFTKTVGLEMAQKGNITCNAICPGYVLTDLIRNQLEDTAKARGISKVCTRSLTLSAIQRGSVRIMSSLAGHEVHCSMLLPCQLGEATSADLLLNHDDMPHLLRARVQYTLERSLHPSVLCLTGYCMH